MSEKRWIYPTQVDGDIEEEIVEQWREKGFALVNGLLPDYLVKEAQKALVEYYEGEAGKQAREKRDFGGKEFPYEIESLNDITLHPNIIETVKKLLKTDDVRLTQSDAWVKFGGEVKNQYDNQNQRVHIDGWNHMLVCPPDWYSPVSVAMIVYLSDVTQTGGATSLAARNGDQDPAYSKFYWLNTPGAGSIPWINDKERAEEWLSQNRPDIAKFREQLYNREEHARFSLGSVLIYRHDVWHRGTPLDKSDSMRLVINLSFRRADADWFNNWNAGWAKSMYTSQQTLERLIAKSSVSQRNVLGFPKPGHPYWTADTLKAVTLRYQDFGFDPNPYKLKLKLQ